MILAMMGQKIRQHELGGRSPSHRRLAWIAAATVNAYCSYRHSTTAEAAAAPVAVAAFLTMVPRRNHHHICDSFVLVAGRAGSASASCLGSPPAMISPTRRPRHDVSPWICQQPLQQQQQHALRISGCRWMTKKAISDEENVGFNEDRPGKRGKQRKNNKQQKSKEHQSVAAAIDTPPTTTKSAQELAQDAENREIENAVRNWLEQIVIGLNLCPFAERPLRTNKLRIHIVRGNDEHVLLSSMLCALWLQKEQESGTTLVVCPECHANDFRQYLNVLNAMEALLEDHDLTGVLQIAPFHPLFEFEGSSSSSSSSVDNYTNRAPYPIFHILREDEVEQAVEMLQGDAGRVWKRNVRLLETMYEALGDKDFQHLMKPCSTAGKSGSGTTITDTATMALPQQQNNITTINDKVRAILRRHRIQLSRSSPSLSHDGYDDDDDDSKNDAVP